MALGGYSRLLHGHRGKAEADFNQELREPTLSCAKLFFRKFVVNDCVVCDVLYKSISKQYLKT